MPSDPDHRETFHMTFARTVVDEVNASDDRVTRGKMIQLSIYGDVNEQWAMGVS
jgi:hypothetical protein